MKETVNQKERASIGWKILIKLAKKKNLITYGEIAVQMNIHHRTVRFFLALIQDYCLKNNLPPLTILVINKKGKQGEGFIASNENRIQKDLLAVYGFDWESIKNPFGKPKTVFTGYWTFFCNPAKWQLDKFLETKPNYDTYQITDWQKNNFHTGQLGIIRVGKDSRTKLQLNDSKRLNSGIYAIVEIVSEPEIRQNKPDKYWIDWSENEFKKPIVKIKILKNLLHNPILLDDIKKEVFEFDKYLINGFQAASMPLEKETFERIIQKIDNSDDIFKNSENEKFNFITDIQQIEEKYKNATPQIKKIISRRIERGQISNKLKKINDYKCQICEALGKNPHSFETKRGNFYVETHHIIPVSEQVVGSLGIANLLTLCANHHRQLHYGNVDFEITEKFIKFTIDDKIIEIKKNNLQTI